MTRTRAAVSGVFGEDMQRHREATGHPGTAQVSGPKPHPDPNDGSSHKGIAFRLGHRTTKRAARRQSNAVHLKQEAADRAPPRSAAL